MDRDALYARYEEAFTGITPPFAFVDLDALRANGEAMLAQAGGKPIRVASKSIRSVALLRRILALDERFRGLLNFTLPEALHLFRLGFRDLVVAYPTTDREAISDLAELVAGDGDGAPVLMVDSPQHLDLIEGAIGAGPAQVSVAIDADAGWWPLGGRVRIGPRRSPVHAPEQARDLAREIVARPSVRLAGLMAYEGQVAGVGDAAPGHPFRNLAIRLMQRASMRELAKRRAEIVAAVTEVAPLGFVNGGGTGSLSRTAAEDAVSELAAGSGFFDPVLFDHYRSLALRPAGFFVLPVSRRPATGVATVLGGGYVASGPIGGDRLPEAYLPEGLRLDPREGAGEVQTPLLGAAATDLRLGDRVYLRHAKAGELCERFGSLYLVEGTQVVDEVPTYRGEGLCFL